MPNPTPGSLHVDTYLTDVSVAYVQSSTAFVADRVFPRVPVAKQSDIVPMFSRADFLRDEMAKRAAGSEVRRVGYRTESTSYIADEWALEHPIDDQVRANADGPFAALDENAAAFLTQKMLIKREREFVTNFLSTNLWTGSSDGDDLVSGTDFTAWSNPASTPIEDVERRQTAMESRTGALANKLVVGRQVWSDLKNHPDIIDRIKYTSSETVTTQLVARLMGLDEVLVASAVYNTAGEGLAHSGAHIMADSALLVHTPTAPGLMTPAAGYTFVWTGLIGSNNGQVIERYREDRAVSDIVRIRGAWAQKRIAPDLGILYSNASTNS